LVAPRIVAIPLVVSDGLARNVVKLVAQELLYLGPGRRKRRRR
jgi:hypothetical protein